MRCFLLAILSVTLQLHLHLFAAEEKNNPAPITISCGDVPAWWQGFSQTWFGQTWLSPAFDSERQFVSDFFTKLESDTSVAVPWSADKLQAFVFQRDGDGALLSLRTWGNTSGDEVFANVKETYQRQQQERLAHWENYVNRICLHKVTTIVHSD
jgi:hypothetical protein